ncbi:hypothetical protein QF031_003058 [Pseudarthrobacter defluvii]|nr:hypothetical protein [Pseudarthrobacter defluvii]
MSDRAGTVSGMSTQDTPAQIGDLPPLGRPANTALLNAGITTLSEVANHSRKELLGMHGVGPAQFGSSRQRLQSAASNLANRPRRAVAGLPTALLCDAPATDFECMIFG